MTIIKIAKGRRCRKVKDEEKKMKDIEKERWKREERGRDKIERGKEQAEGLPRVESSRVERSVKTNWVEI